MEIEIARIKEAYQIAEQMGKTLIVAYSGGKDSDVLLDLAIKSEVPFEVQHNHTTADAPETVYHIRAVFERLNAQGIPAKINYPPNIVDADGKTVRATMWNLIIKKQMPPTRLIRYCCEYFKERRFEGQHMLFGIRWAESNQRKTRGVHETLTKKNQGIVYSDENDDRHKLTEICHMKNKVATNPIIDWTDDEIWDYIKQNGIITNPLYAQGFKRVGCIGCPMAGEKGQRKEFERFPKYRDLYVRAFDKMLEYKEKRRQKTGKYPNPSNWKNGEMVMKWWINRSYNPDQMTFDDCDEKSDDE